MQPSDAPIKDVSDSTHVALTWKCNLWSFWACRMFQWDAEVFLFLQTDSVVFWRGAVAVVLPVQIQNQPLQALILVDPGDGLLLQETRI